MFGSLNKKLLNLARAAAMERDCPNCGKKFKPYAGREFTSWSEFNQSCTCPNCGRSYTIEELARKPEEREANPKGPFARPPESRIERRQPAPHQVAFHLPAYGRWGPWLLLAIVWNIFTWPVIRGFLENIGARENKLPLVLGTSLFVAAGIGLIYVALRHRYGSTLLELTPGTIRLQRTLLGAKRTHEVLTSDVCNISKVVFYSQNYQPVYGIEIAASRRRLRFGSTLTDDEKNWLCWEIQEYVRVHGGHAEVSAAVQALTRQL